MIIVILLGFILKIAVWEWVVCIVLFALVIGAELFNTSIEEVVNLLSPEIRIHAKYAKDIAAGAVLVFALASAIVGVIIFLPKIISLF